MDILFLSHCVPNPPDKGEKIRAHHEVTCLAAKHRLHLACFARNDAEVQAAYALRDRCASVYVERLSPKVALARAMAQFAMGRCLNAAFYSSRRMRQHVESLAPATTVAYSVVMGQYAPRQVPLLLDLVDVDSEKWFQYGQARWPGFAYRSEAQRLRRLEIAFADRAVCNFLSTPRELEVFQRFAPSAVAKCMENGVDFEYFDPSRCARLPELRGRRFLLFLGAMDYYPNIDAVQWFAEHVFRELKRKHPDFEFYIVGRNPSKAVLRLSKQNGVTVTGSVPDVRPYLEAAMAVVAPLRIARGIQNKVLEALAMGKTVLASPEICSTFGDKVPAGVVCCASEQEYICATDEKGGQTPFRAVCEMAVCPPFSRQRAMERFSWDRNTRILSDELEGAACLARVS
jgi:sugar transferase (PEP-CTERM/EpsH1 system associated)